MAMDVRAQACSYLRAGAVDVLEALPSEMPLEGWPSAAGYVRAVVRGHSGPYLVSLSDGKWSCDRGCGSTCAHIAAVQVVTGWPSLARKAAKA